MTKETNPLPEQKTIFFEDAIRHNQNEWCNRKKGPLTLTSPIEVQPSFLFLGKNTINRIFPKFGDYINPVYHENPLLIGASLLADTSLFNKDLNFYIPSAEFNSKKISSFTENNVVWLTSVALGKNPIKELTNSNFMSKLEEPTKALLSSAKKGNLDEVTEAIASFHFLGSTDKINNLFDNDGQVSFQSIEEWLKQNTSSGKYFSTSGIGMELDSKSSDDQSKQLNINVGAGLLHLLSITVMGGFSVIPGIINLFPFPKSPLSISKIATHEAIHSFGKTPSHSQGVPAVYISS